MQQTATTLSRNNPSRILTVTTNSTIDGFTITGGSANNGGGIYIGNGSPTLVNTLVWNSNASNTISISNNPTISLDHCALSEGISLSGGTVNSSDIVYVSTSWTPVSSNNIITIESNDALSGLVGAALSNDNTPKTDQLGRPRWAKTIGAVEIVKVIKGLSLDITADKENVTLAAISSDKITFTVNHVSADYGYNILEPVSLTPTWSYTPETSGITIANGVLTISKDIATGSYNLTVTATVTSNDKTGTASKIVTVTKNAPKLTALESALTADKESVTLSAESADTVIFTPIVSADYDTGNVIKLDSGAYTLAWTPTITPSDAGITFSDGTLTIAKATTPGTYTAKITINVSSGDVTASAEKSITITKNPRVLTKLDAVINSDKTALNLNVGSSDKITFTPTVTAVFDNGDTDNSPAYNISWSMNPSVSGMTLANGVLTVGSSTAAGDYAVKVTANVSSGDVTTSAEKSVNVTVNEVKTPEPEPTPAPESNPESDPESNPNPEQKTEYEKVIEKTEDYINSMTEEEKDAVFSLALDGAITDLGAIVSQFRNVEIVILSNTESLDTVDLSVLPANVKTVDISGNTGLKTLSLKTSTVKEVIAAGCENLVSVDLENNIVIEILDVSETRIDALNAAGCENLQSLNCSSCDINSGSLNLAGCVKLSALNISNNHFMRFDYDSAVLKSLAELLCAHQTIYTSLLGRTIIFGEITVSGSVSAADDETDSFAANVQNVKGYDSEGGEIELISYDKETGEAVFDSAPVRVTYDYITGFSDVNMDVEISGTAEERKVLGESGGGCNAGFGLMILGALLILTRIVKAL